MRITLEENILHRVVELFTDLGHASIRWKKRRLGHGRLRETEHDAA
jgi:hypothetical protein